MDQNNNIINQNIFNIDTIIHTPRILTYTVNNNIETIKSNIYLGVKELNNYLFDFISLQNINTINLPNYFIYTSSTLVTLITPFSLKNGTVI